MSTQITKSSRENSVKMLLTNTLVTSVNPSVNSELSSSDDETEMDENAKAFLTYVRQAAYGPEDEIDIIMNDHAYARPWNWRPEHVYVRPAKKIFYSNFKRDSSNDELIDIEKEDTEPEGPSFDLFKARQAMDELQRVANFVRPEDTDDWEEKIDKILWSPVQNRIFNRVVKLLNTEHICRLSQSNSKYEPIRRRTSIDKTTKKFRETLASANWDWRITQWLHSLLFDHLPQDYLAIYLDLLQTLRQKIPQLVDKMIAVQPNVNSKNNAVTWEILGPLLKKSWDPLPPTLTANKLKKLPGNPILIVVPNGLPNNISSRHHKWIAQLGTLGMVVTVNPHLGLTANRITVIAGIEQLLQVTRAKIQDVKVDYPGRPIILVGFNTGAALACQVSQMEHVTAIVCLGFPMNTVDGKRGNPDDCLLDVRCPVMFVIGQNSILARLEDIEDLRKDMIVPTRLLLVGSADDHLRISISKRITKQINQSIVDRSILDEIGDFVGGILLQSHSLPLRTPNSMNNYENRHKRSGGSDGKKRKTSTSSSVDSEPQSPSLKKLRAHSPQHPSANNGQRIPINTNVLPKGALVTLTGTTATQTPRRKSRGSFNSQNYSDQLITSRLTPQQQNMDNSAGGITLNIGSLASLAPVGPIRFESTSISLQSTPAGKAGVSTLKTSNAFIKVSKSNQVNIGSPQQNVAKIKMIMPTKKSGQRTYKNSNVPEKPGEINMVNVLSPTSTGIRVSAPTATVTNMKTSAGTTNVPALPSFQVAKSTAGMTLAGKSVTPANVVLTTKSFVQVATTATATTPTPPKALQTASTKVADISMVNSSKKHSMIQTNQLNQVPRSMIVGAGTVVREKSQTGLTSKISLQKLHWPQTKVETAENTIKSLTESNESSQITANSLDDDLGNILDIPIIIAKEGENINNLERLSPLPQTMTPVTLQSSEVKSLPVINAVGNKVVFINKNLTSLTDGSSSTNTVTLSRPVLTTSQPTIKYTKIILTKKPEHEESQKGNHVILTKTGRRANNFVVLDPKSEVKYSQTMMRIPASSLGEAQTNENTVSPSHISKVLTAKHNLVGLNVKNGGKS